MQKWRVKTMLTSFSCAKNIIHQEFVSQKHTLDSKFYKDVIKRLMGRVHCVKPELQGSGPWYLLHDNSPVYSSGAVSKFLAK
jgi:hypothetical protein